MQARSFATPDEIYISTDDKRIARIGAQLGVNVVKRPEKYSSDNSPAADVVKHFIEYLTECDLKPSGSEVIVYLQPTSPFRTSKEILECIETYKNSGKPTLTIKVSPVNELKILKINEKGKLVGAHPDSSPTSNRQQLNNSFIASGAVYVFSIADFLQYGDIPVLDAEPIFSDLPINLDIDSPIDLEIAQFIGERYGI